MKDFLIALYVVCCNWHSGQFSKGYHVACLCDTYLQRWFDYDPQIEDGPLTDNQKRLVDILTERYKCTL